MAARNWNGRDPKEMEVIGKYYGYPECCVGHFSENVGRNGWNEYARGSWAEGTGFIPCPECLARPKEDLVSEIAERRCQRTKFPDGDFELCKKELGIIDHA